MSLEKARVMGILNLTPDSFYAKSRVKEVSSFLQKAGKMIEEGATFLDLGGYSSRPGATDISVEEEKERLLPFLTELKKRFPEVLVSIDTFRSDVARVCLDHGADLINDISGGMLDSNLFQTVSEFNVPYVLMHMRGTPQNMQTKTDYKDVTADVIRELSKRVFEAKKAGIKDIIVDPGFGFAKTVEQNFELFGSLGRLDILECPLLVGISRKSMIYRTLNTTAENSLNGTSVMNTIALLSGAKILRVHDVKEAVECINLVEKTVS